MSDSKNQPPTGAAKFVCFVLGPVSLIVLVALLVNNDAPSPRLVIGLAVSAAANAYFAYMWFAHWRKVK